MCKFKINVVIINTHLLIVNFHLPTFQLLHALRDGVSCSTWTYKQTIRQDKAATRIRIKLVHIVVCIPRYQTCNKPSLLKTHTYVPTQQVQERGMYMNV